MGAHETTESYAGVAKKQHAANVKYMCKVVGEISRLVLLVSASQVGR